MRTVKGGGQGTIFSIEAACGEDGEDDGGDEEDDGDGTGQRNDHEEECEEDHGRGRRMVEIFGGGVGNSKMWNRVGSQVYTRNGRGPAIKLRTGTLCKLMPHFDHAAASIRNRPDTHFRRRTAQRGGTTLDAAQTSSTRDTFFPGAWAPCPALPYEPGTASLGMPNLIGRQGKENTTSGACRAGHARRVEVEGADIWQGTH